MQIIKIFRRLFICILCTCCLCFSSFASESNLPFGDIGEYGSWITKDNMLKFNTNMSQDMESFQNKFSTNLHSSNFVPLEVKIGLAFMKALSSMDYILHLSLIRFTIIFLFLMYAFWVGLEAYKMIREATEYKIVLYDIFKRGFILAIWVSVLLYGPAKTFTMLITPIIAFSNYLSDFILTSVAETYNINLPDTCATIQQYVATHSTDKLLVDPETAANIMCLPARLSVYFYNALSLSFNWILSGFWNNTSSVVLGIISVYIFVKAIFKYAFMTLGIVADLFLTLLMLPFTALAEAMPETKESNYFGQILSGFLGMFKTKKLSEVFLVFINAAIYFVSLAVIVAIAAGLLSYIIRTDPNNTHVVSSAMITIICGCLVLHIVNEADKLATDIGGKIDNSFGEKVKNKTKEKLGDLKKFTLKLVKAWAKK